MQQKNDFIISKLGHCKYPSPLNLLNIKGDMVADYESDNEYIVYNIERTEYSQGESLVSEKLMEKAGPRKMIYFDPKDVSAGIVTCGGLCPGINNVIREIVMCLWYRYGVERITGIQYGLRGFLPEFGYSPVTLTPEVVDDIHYRGGTVLGSSRGGGNRIPDIVDSIQKLNFNQLYVIGGDGSQRGALAIADELEKRKLKIAVIGIPKTIDNDLSFIQKSFGFDTAVSEAADVVTRAHIEAHDAINGIAIVKVMGRESGFIAAYTAIAQNDVNFVLIPEVPFELSGPNGFLANLKSRIEKRRHAVILIAEGAGQNLLQQSDQYDASGNKIIGDIGVLLRDSIKGFFKELNREVTMRYFDPSYFIRSARANSSDSLYCMRLGNNAAHAAMTGRTKMIVSLVNDHFVHVPINIVISKRSSLDPESSLWRDVIDNTGQPALMVN